MDTVLYVQYNYFKEDVVCIECLCVRTLTDTMYSSVVECIPHGAFTAERAVCVDTVSIVTDAWVL